MSDPKDDKSQGEEPAAQTRSRKKLVLLAVLALGVLGGGGAAGWYFMGPAETDAPVAEKKRGAPIFTPLDAFTVNLADEDGDRVAQVAVVLELTDGKANDEIKTQMPAVRNGILLLLSAKKSSELLTLAGKEQLAGEIALVTGRLLGWKAPPANAPAAPAAPEPAAKGGKGAAAAKGAAPPNPVAAVHFSQFLVQ